MFVLASGELISPPPLKMNNKCGFLGCFFFGKEGGFIRWFLLEVMTCSYHFLPSLTPQLPHRCSSVSEQEAGVNTLVCLQSCVYNGSHNRIPNAYFPDYSDVSHGVLHFSWHSNVQNKAYTRKQTLPVLPASLANRFQSPPRSATAGRYLGFVFFFFVFLSTKAQVGPKSCVTTR